MRRGAHTVLERQLCKVSSPSRSRTETNRKSRTSNTEVKQESAAELQDRGGFKEAGSGGLTDTVPHSRLTVFLRINLTSQPQVQKCLAENTIHLFCHVCHNRIVSTALIHDSIICGSLEHGCLGTKTNNERSGRFSALEYQQLVRTLTMTPRNVPYGGTVLTRLRLLTRKTSAMPCSP